LEKLQTVFRKYGKTCLVRNGALNTRVPEAHLGFGGLWRLIMVEMRKTVSHANVRGGQTAMT
jgi:hypothetical protein